MQNGKNISVSDKTTYSDVKDNFYLNWAYMFPSVNLFLMVNRQKHCLCMPKKKKEYLTQSLG